MTALSINATDRDAPKTWGDIKIGHREHHTPEYCDLMKQADDFDKMSGEIIDSAIELETSGTISEAEWYQLLTEAANCSDRANTFRSKAIDVELEYWAQEIAAREADYQDDVISQRP